jgi:predicted GNAT family acetyltransferase
MFTRIDHPAPFLAAARPLLLEDEAHFGLVLGIALDLDAHLRASGADAALQKTSFGVGADSGQSRLVVALLESGLAVLTDGRVPVSTATLREAAETLARSSPRLAGIRGSQAVVERFSPLWSNVTAARARVHQRQRVHRLDELTAPAPIAGHMRLATVDDLELVRRWRHRFSIDVGETHEGAPIPERVAQLDTRRLYLWVTDRPIAMAGWARPTPCGCAINSVFTPEEQRRRGYASALVAALTRGVLDGITGLGPKQFTCLHTDLANPTSNGVYARLGYRPVSDSLAVNFEYD